MLVYVKIDLFVHLCTCVGVEAMKRPSGLRGSCCKCATCTKNIAKPSWFGTPEKNPLPSTGMTIKPRIAVFRNGMWSMCSSGHSNGPFVATLVPMFSAVRKSRVSCDDTEKIEPWTNACWLSSRGHDKNHVVYAAEFVAATQGSHELIQWNVMTIVQTSWPVLL